MPVIITSKQDKFRRCGMAHPKAATTYPDGKFSKKELAILQAESMLTVVIVADPEVEKAAKEKAAANPSDQSNPTDQTNKSSNQDDKGGALATKPPAQAKPAPAKPAATKPAAPVKLAAVAKPVAKK